MAERWRNRPLPSIADRDGSGDVARYRSSSASVPETSAGNGDGMSERWYKEAVIYCVDVETFQDSDGDGRGATCGD